VQLGYYLGQSARGRPFYFTTAAIGIHTAMQREGVFRAMKRRTVLASFGSDRTPAITGSLGVRCQQPGHDKTD
jgi:hypothetical protein